MTRFAVLGGGPAGLWCGLRLAERGFPVTVFEAHDAVGGNAGSFEIGGHRVDYGSHRLHPSTDPAILSRLRQLLGDDLLARPRHGRIRLQGRWIHFPLRLLDLLLRVPPRFALGVARDLATQPFRGRASSSGDSFATVLERGLGRTICRDFYFPYAHKIWGLAPEEISPLQARRRVAAGSITKILRRLLPSAGGGDQAAAGAKRIFYYPRRGFGQISERIADAAVAAGATVRLGARVRGVSRGGDGGFEIALEGDGERSMAAADRVWSTIPAPYLARIAQPSAPAEVLEAAAGLRLRAMVLVYLVLGQSRFSEYDAHYFPGAEVPFTRVSEPPVYADRREPDGSTVLCAEIPCDRSDPVWSLDAEALGRLVADGLADAGLPVRAEVLEVGVRRLGQVYPIYQRGFEAAFERVDAWMSGVPDLLSFGRQGLYAHDNTHHALSMAEAAVECVDEGGSLNREKWREYREVFASHVVED